MFKLNSSRLTIAKLVALVTISSIVSPLIPLYSVKAQVFSNPISSTKDFNRDSNRDFNRNSNRDFNRDSNRNFNRDFDVSRIPNGTIIPVRHDEAEKILVTKDETIPLTLRVTRNIRDGRGNVLIPSGSQVVGQIEPVSSRDGSRFVADYVLINGRDIPLDATSNVVTRTEVIREGASGGDILEGAIIGAAAATVISAVIGDGIPLEGVLGGAGLGALAGFLLGDEERELISIDPNFDLDLTVRSRGSSNGFDSPNRSNPSNRRRINVW